MPKKQPITINLTLTVDPSVGGTDRFAFKYVIVRPDGCFTASGFCLAPSAEDAVNMAAGELLGTLNEALDK